MSAKPASIESARAAKELAKRTLANVPGVAGVGLTRKGMGYAVKVNLMVERDDLPKEFDGVPVVVELVGSVRKT